MVLVFSIKKTCVFHSSFLKFLLNGSKLAEVRNANRDDYAISPFCSVQ